MVLQFEEGALNLEKQGLITSVHEKRNYFPNNPITTAPLMHPIRFAMLFILPKPLPINWLYNEN